MNLLSILVILYCTLSTIRTTVDYRDFTMKRLTASKVRETFSDTLNRVSYGKERIILQRRNKDIAALVPIEDILLLEELEEREDIADALEALEEYERTGEAITIEEYRQKRGI